MVLRFLFNPPGQDQNRIVNFSHTRVDVLLVNPVAIRRISKTGPGRDYARVDRRSEFENFVLYKVINSCVIKKLDPDRSICLRRNSPYIVATEVIPVGNP